MINFSSKVCRLKAKMYLYQAVDERQLDERKFDIDTHYNTKIKERPNSVARTVIINLH